MVKGEGIYSRFMSVNPSDETFDLALGIKSGSEWGVPFNIAENVPREDFIVLETIIFPGINLFWLGSVIMLMGMTMSLVVLKRGRQHGQPA